MTSASADAFVKAHATSVAIKDVSSVGGWLGRGVGWGLPQADGPFDRRPFHMLAYRLNRSALPMSLAWHLM